MNKIKAIDTIGGAIEIQYDENGMSKTELLVEKEWVRRRIETTSYSSFL